jgi:hypothetical protein
MFRPRKAIALQLGAPLGSPVPRYGNIPARCGPLSTLPTMVRGRLASPGERPLLSCQRASSLLDGPAIGAHWCAVDAWRRAPHRFRPP